MTKVTVQKYLDQILPNSEISADLNVVVSGISSDSRTVVPGELFIACQGVAVNGRDYIDQAIEKGAVAVVLEADAQHKTPWLYRGVALIPLIDVRGQLGQIAANFFDRPGEQLQIIGVTGTNGKTSCSQYIAQLLSRMQHKAAVVGTLGWGVGTHLRKTMHTTPDAIQLQRILRELKNHGAEYVAMEVSSHGLEQRRVEALAFNTAVFTNLSHDHLDYHDTMEAYGAAKQKLFLYPGLKHAVINGDDPFGRKLLRNMPASVSTYVFSTRSGDADIVVDSVDYSLHGLLARISTPWGKAELKSSLLGEFNLSNLLAVVAVMGVLGMELDEVIKQISRLTAVAGRMEQVDNNIGINIVIDYAHTPDALSNVLRAVRQHCAGNLWCVFGCGGDRDALKRPLMGEIASRMADYVVITNDNPRNEKPEDIARDVLSGCLSRHQVVVELDRAKAIRYALQHAQPGDSVLIAGKGHEDYQEMQGQRLPFSDRVEVEKVIASSMSAWQADDNDMFLDPGFDFGFYGAGGLQL